MVSVFVQFSTNFCNEEVKIEKGAIEEFTRNAYGDGSFRAVVSFECKPHAFDPKIMQIIIDLKDISETIIACGVICKELISFAKRVHGYKKHILIDGVKNSGDIIEITDETTPKGLEKEMKNVIKDELAEVMFFVKTTHQYPKGFDKKLAAELEKNGVIYHEQAFRQKEWIDTLNVDEEKLKSIYDVVIRED